MTRSVYIYILVSSNSVQVLYRLLCCVGLGNAFLSIPSPLPLSGHTNTDEVCSHVCVMTFLLPGCSDVLASSMWKLFTHASHRKGSTICQ